MEGNELQNGFRVYVSNSICFIIFYSFSSALNYAATDIKLFIDIDIFSKLTAWKSEH